MRTSIRGLGLIMIVTIGSHFATRLYAQEAAETIFHNGRILTVSNDFGDFPIEQALAIREGRIEAVGSNDAVLRLAGPSTKRVDLQGKAMLPGLVNTHKHPNRDALLNYYHQLPPQYQKSIKAAGMIFDWSNKDQVLLQIEKIVQSADPDLALVVIGGRPRIGYVGLGPSLLVNAPPPGYAESRGILIKELAQLGLRVSDLDPISHGRAVMILLGGGGIMNTKALEMALEKFPTGQYRFESVVRELLPQPPPEVLAPIYKKELLEHNANDGYTTLSSRYSENEVATFGVLDRAGELPLRVGYAQQVEPIELSEFDNFVQYLKEVETRYKSEKLWMTGLTGVPLDSSPDGGGICSSYPRQSGVSEDFNFASRCYNWDRENDPRLEVLRRLNRLGYRFSNMHSWADLALERALEFYQELDREKPLKGRRFAFDHTALLSPRVLELAKDFGIYWSFIPTALATQRGMIMRQVYGDEIVDSWGGPVRKILDAGMRVTFEGEFEGANPWRGMQFLVTRRDDFGKVRGSLNGVDRKTALRIMTRWGAEYVLREDRIGSIEVGKYADLIVLDKNPLDPALPDYQLSALRVLLTMVGGDVVYRATDFEM